MTQPVLYKLGIENRSFGPQVFWSWIVYAFWQGWLIVVFTFIFNQMPESQITGNHGLVFGFWSAGMTTYGVCVLVVNAVLLKMTNNYTGVCEALIIIQCSLYWLSIFIECRFKFFLVLYASW